tara:strand:+ start:300 stop:518 length:219 start_codon:yes stop_codon:yes gene_type:complete
MIALEKFSHLVSSTSQQNKQQIIMSVADGQALLNDILAMQNQLIQVQNVALRAIEEAKDPIPNSIEADAGRF